MHEKLFSKFSDGLILLELQVEGEFLILDVNHAFETMSGKDAASLRGMRLEKALPEIGRITREIVEKNSKLSMLFPAHHFCQNSRCDLQIQLIDLDEGNFALSVKNISEFIHAEKMMQLNVERLGSLVRIAQYDASSIQDLVDYSLSEAIDLTMSKIGYIYFYSESKKEFTLNTWSRGVMDECAVLDPQTVYQLDKTGCWGEAVRQRSPFITNDYGGENPYRKGTPQGHIQLTRFCTVPVIIGGEIVAVIGVANKDEDYNDNDVRQLTLLMESLWKIINREKKVEEYRNALAQARREIDKLRGNDDPAGKEG